MSLAKSYRNAGPDAALVTIPLVIIMSMVVSPEDKSEWLSSGSTVFVMFVGAVAYSLWMCVLCLPIFFCKHDKVKGNKNLTALEWFAAPIGFMALVFFNQYLNLNQYLNRDMIAHEGYVPVIYTLCLNIPFLIALIWSYSKHLRFQLN